MQTNPDSPFASVVGLGALKSEHPHGGRAKWLNLIIGAGCLVAVPIAGLLAAYFIYDDYNRRGSTHMFDNAIAPLICGGIALVLGIPILLSSWRNWPLAAALYENGFAYHDRQGVKQVPWNQIEAVWQSVTRHYTNGVYTGTTHLYTVQAQNGVKIKMDDKLAKVEDLGQEIQRGAATSLFPRYWQALQSGQRLTFGPLALDTQGLYSGKKELRWSEIKGVKIERGTISVRKEKGWFPWATATVPQIPNFYIFYELVGRFTQVE
ncbi:MAG: DUF6585 family protein [Anaerolineales bacterium]